MKEFDRREFMRLMGTAGALTGLSALGVPTAAFAKASGKVVVVGGGFGGATCATYLKRWGPGLDVTVVEKDTKFLTCPFSNGVLGGLWGLDKITHSYDGMKARGIKVVHDTVTGVDAGGKKISLKNGGSMSYDMLVLSPGISFIYDRVENDTKVEEKMPHAWKAGPQTQLLRKQLEAMKDGGTVLILPPPKPFRCPPGPYERASLIAHYLKTKKPKSRIIILDSNESHSKQKTFHAAWKHLYGMGEGKLIHWRKETDGGKIVKLDPGTMTVHKEFGEKVKGDVINFIPYQKAAKLVHDAKLVNKDGWCDVHQNTFESKVAKDVYVLGDSCVAGAMPKSGHSASSQAKNCAAAIVSKLAGKDQPTPSYNNTCYSFIGPEFAISVAAVYAFKEGSIKKTSAGVSPPPPAEKDRFYKNEAKYTRGWYKSITSDMFG